MSEKKNDAKNFVFTINYLKFIVIYSTCLAITLLLIKTVFLLDILDINEKPSDAILTLLALISLIVTCIGYYYHRQRDKAEVLGQYNERYSRDEHVKKVVDYIIHYMDGKKVASLPSTHDAELFMRFFEEIEIQIKEDRMDEQQVYSLFAYYAIRLGEDEKTRLSLGISKDEYDKSNEWKYFKEFVNRMIKIRTEKDDCSREKAPVESDYNFKPICQLFNDVINNNSWNYYENESIIKSFDQIYETGDLDGNNKNYVFVCNLLKAGSKNLSDILNRCLEALKNNEQNNDERELKGRVRHIVSLFFWGHVLYQNILVIKLQIERQFNEFVSEGIFEKDDDIQQCFSFMWFLLCIFHDFGYAYEKKLNTLPEEISTSEDLEMPDGFMPAIYSKENIDNYAKYRHCVFGCKDHGIYGGRVFYDEMLKIGKEIANCNLKIHFKNEGVDKIYRYAAWVISCHNIFYNNGNDSKTSCYKCMGLDEFVKSKARCVTLRNNPLLFLFCLADSIEPTKTLTSPNGNSDFEVCRELKLGFNMEKNLMKFDLSYIKCKEVANKYEKNIKCLDDWLIDVSDNLTIKFC